MQDKQIPIRIRTELRDWIRKRAMKCNRSMARMIRDLIDDEIKKETPTIKPTTITTATNDSVIMGAWFEDRHLKYMDRMVAAGWYSRARFISALIARERDRLLQQ